MSTVPVVRRLSVDLNTIDSATSLSSKRPVAGGATRPFVPKTSSILSVTSGSDEGAFGKLFFPDAIEGNRLVQMGSTCDGAEFVSKPLPSSKPIAALLSLTQSESCVVLASDSKGNIFSIVSPTTTDQGEEASESKRKNRRTEGIDGTHEWSTVVRFSDTEPLQGALPTYGCPGGWVGIRSLGNGGSFACGREYYKDVRIVDSVQGSVVRSYFPSHQPTSIATTSNSTLVVAEGTVISGFDVRCKDRIAQNRITSASGCFHSVATIDGDKWANTVVASSDDRSVSLFDLRKWAKVCSAQNVLKYVVMNVAPIRGGEYLVCSGGDSEVRVIPTPKEGPAAGGQRKSAAAKDCDEGADCDATQVGGTFRTRIDEAVHCESSWLGGWATNGQVGLGLAITNELYIA